MPIKTFFDKKHRYILRNDIKFEWIHLIQERTRRFDTCSNRRNVVLLFTLEKKNRFTRRVSVLFAQNYYENRKNFALFNYG